MQKEVLQLRRSSLDRKPSSPPPSWALQSARGGRITMILNQNPIDYPGFLSGEEEGAITSLSRAGCHFRDRNHVYRQPSGSTAVYWFDEAEDRWSGGGG